MSNAAIEIASELAKPTIKSLINFSFQDYPRNYLVMGKPRTGKTRLLFNILQRIRTNNHERIGGFRLGDLRRLNLELRQRWEMVNWKEISMQNALMQKSAGEGRQSKANMLSPEMRMYEEFYGGQWSKRLDGIINIEGKHFPRNDDAEGFPSEEFENFAMNELNNDNKSLFLIDGIGRQTATRSKRLNLKIMNLFQDPERVVIATADQDMTYGKDELPFLDVL